MIAKDEQLEQELKKKGYHTRGRVVRYFNDGERKKVEVEWPDLLSGVSLLQEVESEQLQPDSGSDECIVYVKMLSGEEYALPCRPSDHVVSLKTKLLKIFNIPAIDISLFKDGVSLPLERGSLQEHGCVNGTCLQAFVKDILDKHFLYWYTNGQTELLLKLQATGRVLHIISTERAKALLKADGGVVAWGKADCGGDCSSVQEQLTCDVQSIHCTNRAFAALKGDGSMITWGSPAWGGLNPLKVQNQLARDVQSVFASPKAFAALKFDGTVIVWGHRSVTQLSEIPQEVFETRKCL